MKKFSILIVFLLGIFSNYANATIYIAYTDHHTGDRGLAVITSGSIYSNSSITFGEKDGPLIGWSGQGRVAPEADKLIQDKLSQDLSVDQVTALVEQKYPAQYYRLLFVDHNGEIGHLIPKNGCKVPECGERVEDHFVVMGGGLVQGVLDKTQKAFSEIEQSQLSLPCKLFAGLNAIVKSGGETNTFFTAVLIADVKNKPDLVWANSLVDERGTEEQILNNVGADLKSAGFDCKVKDFASY